MKYIIEQLSNQKKSKFSLLRTIWQNFSSKQKLGVILFAVCLIFTPIVAQTSNYITGNPNSQKQPLETIIAEGSEDSISAINILNENFFGAKIILNIIGYITDSQIDSIKTVAEVPLETEGVFDHILKGLTIFACIGCVYKLITAYIKTEGFDNVGSILGFFSYIPLLVLFIFSEPIVDHLIGLNQNIDGSSLREIVAKIDSEVVREVAKDVAELQEKQKALNQEYDDLNSYEVGNIIANRSEYLASEASHVVNTQIKFAYFGFFAVILVSVLAIPTFLMTFLVKVLLTLMVAGTKIVFLLAFIPGFEDIWKSFLKNILNILLWIPIFNVIVGFIVALVTATITDGSMMTGQIVWLSIVAVVCAFQAVGLTTSTATAIVQGSGAGMAGAMGAIGGMNASSMVSQTVIGAGKAALAVKTAGVGAAAASAAKK
ncbi:hypothetical protein NWE55_16900 (plasmid) [Myroides albus]|uniref:Uncharacterized protein n=1 Tax=Myroides odoratimimus TaxID=76832 RepID=A0AAI8G6N3_9FLAO|nr:MULTISPECIES: hypothetical protein [Myroides]ALU28432.1 hypothetical protein AS202_19825 [Myroides odoratimimus]ALU28502.1 hypothetical protein AS202_20195 [Myroides odoratimimus]UVD81351.1 hypothetical protein NWE55_16900 [Myroides albus]